MTQAIAADSVPAVLRALEQDPLALCKPSGLRRAEPHLVAAVRQASSRELIKTLLEHGADPNECGPDGMTALEALVPMRRRRTPFELHIDAPPQVPVPLHHMLASVWESDAAALAVHGAVETPFAAARPSGFQPPPWELTFLVANEDVASEEQRVLYATLLLAFGADASRVDKECNTPADRATLRGEVELAHLLRHWSGEQVRALSRSSTTLARRPSLSAMLGANYKVCGPPLQELAGLPLGAGGRSCLELLPDEVMRGVCEMIAPVSLELGSRVSRPEGSTGRSPLKAHT